MGKPQTIGGVERKYLNVYLVKLTILSDKLFSTKTPAYYNPILQLFFKSVFTFRITAASQKRTEFSISINQIATTLWTSIFFN